MDRQFWLCSSTEVEKRCVKVDEYVNILVTDAMKNDEANQMDFLHNNVIHDRMMIELIIIEDIAFNTFH